MWTPWKRKPAQPVLDYDQMVHLDAENLAEGGIAGAYHTLLPALSEYVAEPAEIEEALDPDAPSYRVSCAGVDYPIYTAADDDQVNSWANVTYAMFSIVNRQLEAAPVRFYAINGGNDLGGMFLTPEEAQAACAGLPNKADWPYVPNASAPWFGMAH